MVKRAGPFGVLKGFLDLEEDVAEFIRDGPATGIKGWARDRYRDRCNQFANLPGWARALGGPASGTMRRLCTPYWDDNGWDGPEISPPLVSGGQCAGVSYDVTIRTRSPDGTEFTPTIRLGDPGPIRIINDGTTVSCEGAPEGFTAQPGYTYSRAGIPTLSFGNYCGVADPLISVVAVRRDGQPDECGDQEPDERLRPGPNPPPDPGPLPGPEPTDDPRDPTGPPLIPVPPFPDPIGGPTPIEGPDLFPEPDGDTPPVPPPGDVGEPGEPEEPDDGEEVGGCAPAGKVLTGLKVDFLAPPVGGNEYAPGIYRGVCYAYMGTEVGLDHDPAGAMLRDGQFIFAEKDNLTCWALRPSQGYTLRVTPYYREVESSGD